MLKTRNTNRFFYIIGWAIPFIDNVDKITLFKTISTINTNKVNRVIFSQIKIYVMLFTE